MQNSNKRSLVFLLTLATSCANTIAPAENKASKVGTVYLPREEILVEKVYLPARSGHEKHEARKVRSRSGLCYPISTAWTAHIDLVGYDVDNFLSDEEFIQFELISKRGANVYAVFDAEVTVDRKEQRVSLSHLAFSSSQTKYAPVSYVGLENIVVKTGDKVHCGQKIGTAKKKCVYGRPFPADCASFTMGREF